MKALSKACFEEALKLAKENCPGEALAVLSCSPIRNTASDKLKALCLWRLGYFKSAAKYSADFLPELEAYEEMIVQVKPLIREGNYFGAIKTIDNRFMETVIGNQLTGCLFFLARMPGKGRACLFKALELDTSNKDTVTLIQSSNSLGGGKFAELLRNIRYRFECR